MNVLLRSALPAFNDHSHFIYQEMQSAYTTVNKNCVYRGGHRQDCTPPNAKLLALRQYVSRATDCLAQAHRGGPGGRRGRAGPSGGLSRGRRGRRQCAAGEPLGGRCAVWTGRRGGRPRAPLPPRATGSAFSLLQGQAPIQSDARKTPVRRAALQPPSPPQDTESGNPLAEGSELPRRRRLGRVTVSGRAAPRVRWLWTVGAAVSSGA